MIELVGVSKAFGGFTAVHNLSLQVKPGEVVGLLGENGAGKTTTMRMIAGILRPSAGDIQVDGYSLATHPFDVKRRVGLLFGGDVGLYSRLTARENIEYFGRLYGLDEATLAKRLDELTSMMEMNDYLSRRAGTFSRGMKQKVAIARALVHDPQAILLDEPTTGLDVSGAAIFRRLITELRAAGKAILFSSHNMDEVEKLCDRVVVMHKGSIRFHGTIADWRASSGREDITELFLQTIAGGERNA